jgi:hypothetical protein
MFTLEEVVDLHLALSSIPLWEGLHMPGQILEDYIGSIQMILGRHSRIMSTTRYGRVHALVKLLALTITGMSGDVMLWRLIPLNQIASTFWQERTRIVGILTMQQSWEVKTLAQHGHERHCHSKLVETCPDEEWENVLWLIPRTTKLYIWVLAAVMVFGKALIKGYLSRKPQASQMQGHMWQIQQTLQDTTAISMV